MKTLLGGKGDACTCWPDCVPRITVVLTPTISPLSVDERAAAVAVIDRRVSLDRLLHQLVVDDQRRLIR
jgi:hypothetical protein